MAEHKYVFTDASTLITEACVQSGADVFIGYPITPSNRFYAAAGRRFPLFYAGPDEITVLQWMSGFAAAGKFPVTATSFPGLALMTETLNMAFMMELPMLLIIAQRLGPSTGSATTGAQGDLSYFTGAISGAYQMPVFCPSDFKDSWELCHKAIDTAHRFRTPVVLLTSKEMVMTDKRFDLKTLTPLQSCKPNNSPTPSDYRPYQPDENLVPPFVPVGNKDVQVRLNASTHDYDGMIRKGTPEAMGNTKRLRDKFRKRMNELTCFEHDEEQGSEVLLLSYGITSEASRDAVSQIRSGGGKISHLIPKTLLPVPVEISEICRRYKQVVVAEENLSGIYRHLLFGQHHEAHITGVNKIGSLITPSEIVKACSHEQ